MGFRRKLLVLEKAHELLVDLNKALPGIRRSEHQSLKRQLFKSALSVESNLAEGRTKCSQREFLRFLDIALGSSGELQQQLQDVVDCSLLPPDEATDLNKRAEEIAKMIQGLINRIKRDLGDEGEGDDEVSE